MPTPTDLNLALKGKTIESVETPRTGSGALPDWAEADTVILSFSDGLRIRFDPTGYETDGVSWKVLSV